MRNWLIKKLGGYVDVESALLSVTDEAEKRELLTKAVAHLFNVISEEDILQTNSAGQWTVQEKVLSPERAKDLAAQAEVLLKSELWKVLTLDIRWHANKQMYLKSKTEYDVVWGKISVYNLDILKTRLESLIARKATFNGTK